MKCICCGADVQSAPFCGMCGTKQECTTLNVLHSDWKKVHDRRMKSKSGIVGYDNAWRYLSVYGERAVQDLTLEDYQAVLDTIADKSYSLQQKLQQLINQLCLFARVRKINVANFAPFLILDGYRGKSREIFSDAEISRLFLYAKSGGKYMDAAQLVLILIFTGLRPEELFSVKKDQVEFKEHYFKTDGSKTVAGMKRLLPITPIVAPFFTYQYMRHQKSELLICNTSGGRMDLHNWRQRQFYPLMRELEICMPDNPHRLSPYSARHTFASLSNRAGVNKDIITKLIGHTKFDFTEKIYVHETALEFCTEMDKVTRLANEILAS